ncbi:MAG: glycosyltransferase family 4 protein [Pseudomonadota bacterium]
MLDVQFLSFRPMLGYGTTEIRCQQPVQFLREAGKTAKACHFLEAPASKCRLLVLHRVRDTPLISRIVDLARARGATIMYDVDDLIEKNQGDGELDPEIRAAMMKADRVLASGTFLKTKISAFHSDCVVLRNKMSNAILEQGARATEQRTEPNDTVSIGYFSGSNHHDADFRMITPALLRTMHDHKNVRLVVGGKLNIDNAFAEFSERVIFEPFRPYAEFMALLADIDIALAPLDLGSEFAQARSELKYLEAGAFGVPTLASPTLAFKEAIAHGKTGLLVKVEEWYDWLSQCISDAALRRSLGSAARKHIEEKYSAASGRAEWKNLLEAELDHTGQRDTPQRKMAIRAAEVTIRAKGAQAKATLKRWFR